MKNHRMTEENQRGGCFICSKGFATYFWRNGVMQVNCKEFGMVAERDECAAFAPLQFIRKEAISGQ
jgi:hypothetical protein